MKIGSITRYKWFEKKYFFLRKSEALLKDFQFVRSLKMEHGIHCLPCSNINDVIDTLSYNHDVILIFTANKFVTLAISPTVLS